MPGGATLTWPTIARLVGRIRCLHRHPALIPQRIHINGIHHFFTDEKRSAQRTHVLWPAGQRCTL
ncbi:hypothetical protein CBX91_07545 [Salmonella enterica]|uniref:Uncharacterized protein n=1 Tax=Salmonella enterica TaxID=28901 RepID=A0A634F481_SALER|nr:hypothetical protein [Salmonella enterica]